jgi:hypothetical protein
VIGQDNNPYHLELKMVPQREEVERYGPRNYPEQTETLLSKHWYIYQAIKLFCHAETVLGVSRDANGDGFFMQ